MRAWVLFVLIVLVLGVIGIEDYNNAVMENQIYCDMVGAGVWPDYNNNFNEMCEE